jgi:Ser/Thr protein kinase RdoA (MazF antagonist)
LDNGDNLVINANDYFINKIHESNPELFYKPKQIAYDINIAIAGYRRWRRRGQDLGIYKFKDFFEEFCNAYSTYNNLDSIWWERIPLFNYLRTVEMYSWFHKMFDMSEADSNDCQYLKNSLKEMETPPKLF